MSGARGVLGVVAVGLVAVGVVVALAGCGTGTLPLGANAPSTTASPRTTKTAPTASTAPVAPTSTVTPTITTRPVHRAPVMIQLTLANNDQTVAMKVGDSVELVLSDPTMLWGSLSVDPQDPLLPGPSPAPPPHGLRAEWTGREPGTVTVSAVGTAWCSAGTACPMFAMLYKVTVVIS